MVNSITSYSRNGLRDWLLQRATALVIGTFTVMLLGFIYRSSPLTAQAWQGLFACQSVKVLTFMTVLSVVVHAWIGMWTVYTDYVKPTFIRLVFQTVTIFTLIALLVWSASILWGNL